MQKTHLLLPGTGDAVGNRGQGWAAVGSGTAPLLKEVQPVATTHCSVPTCWSGRCRRNEHSELAGVDGQAGWSAWGDQPAWWGVVGAACSSFGQKFVPPKQMVGRVGRGIGGWQLEPSAACLCKCSLLSLGCAHPLMCCRGGFHATAAQPRGCGRAEWKALPQPWAETARHPPALGPSLDSSHGCCGRGSVEFWEDLHFQLEQDRGGIFCLVEYYVVIKNDTG